MTTPALFFGDVSILGDNLFDVEEENPVDDIEASYDEEGGADDKDKHDNEEEDKDKGNSTKSCDLDLGGSIMGQYLKEI